MATKTRLFSQECERFIKILFEIEDANYSFPLNAEVLSAIERIENVRYLLNNFNEFEIPDFTPLITKLKQLKVKQ
jgi:hypothetical protein